MKGTKISLIAILSAVSICLCGILVYGITGRNVFGKDRPQSYNHVQLVLEKEIPLGSIDNISILYSMNSNDVYLYESEKDTVTVKEYSSSELSEKELSTITVKENSLEVRGSRRNLDDFGFHMFYFGGNSYNRHYTEIYLPAFYCGEILLETSSGDIVSELDLKLEKDCAVSSSSGDVRFSDVTASNVSVNTSSGYVTMGKINTGGSGFAGVVSVKTSSGDVDIKEIVGETKLRSSSGYLTAGTITGDVQLKSSSGDVIIDEITGEVKAESTSGYMTIETIKGDAQIQTSSGDILIQRIDGNVQAESTSGYVKIPEGCGDRAISTSSGNVIAGGSESSFHVNTQSGDVQLTLQKGEGSIGTTSGDIVLGLKELAGALNVSSGSGSVDIVLSAENTFEFIIGTGSGVVTTFFDSDLTFSSRKDHAQGTYGANEQGNRIEIQTTSGDVRVSRY